MPSVGQLTFTEHLLCAGHGCLGWATPLGVRGIWGLKLSYRKAGRPRSRPWMTWAEVRGDRPGPLGGERAGPEASSWSASGGEGIQDTV